MIYLPRFAWPSMLILLLILPWAIYLGMRIRSLSRGRKWLAVTLRVIILLCVVGALAGAEIVRTSDRLAVFFLLDHSNSISPARREASAQWVRNMCETYMQKNDEAGVVVFGGDASIELSVAPRLGLDTVRSYVDGEQTDLAGALRLAMAAFPQGYMRRVVAISDGNETQGSVLEEVKAARADGIGIDVLPIPIGEGREVRVREVSAPSQTNADKPFQIRVVVNAKQACTGRLTVYQKAGEQRRMLPPQEVQLQPGDNVFLLSQELSAPGFYEYEVKLDSDADTLSENNVGRAFTAIRGEPSVLYIEGDPAAGTFLENALGSEGIQVARVEPSKMPDSLAQLQNYDGVVLSGVSAVDLSMHQLGLLEAMVRDHGIGLTMIGGPDTFGAGGYLDTPVEKALPVSMDIKQRKVLPRGALAVILHTCEIENGNVWAREIALAALNVLASQDLMGTLGYMWNTNDTWIYALQPVGDKTMMRGAISKASTAIGDMPAMEPTMAMAYEALAAADAAVKRVVVITDGDPSPPSRFTLQKMVDAKISVSTICIAPHSSSDESMLKAIATGTGGEYYFVTDPNKLPLIFAKEAAVVKRGVLVEKEFTPKLLHDSELLTGLRENGLPPLRGYVVTTPKENATVPLVSDEEDPILAHWRYGLGKSVAFTSDVTNRWAAPWLAWDGFNRFWAQTVRWSLRELKPSNFQIETRREKGLGRIHIDAVDAAGQFVNFLQPKGVVTSPNFEHLDVTLEQTGPGIYEGTFPLRESGVYMANLTYSVPGAQEPAAGMIPVGLAVDYSQEYEYLETNQPLLEHVAAAGGGEMLTPEGNPFQHNLKASATVTPIWPHLVMVALCLFPFEIFVRRVVVPLSYFYGGFLWMLRLLPGIRRWIPAPDFRPATATGRYTVAARTFDYGTEAPESSFGETATPTTPLSGHEPTESPVAGDPQAASGHTEYTRRLLAAKDRAGTGRKKRAGGEHDEEKEP